MNPQKPAAATPARLPEGFQAFEQQRIQSALQALAAVDLGVIAATVFRGEGG